MSDGTGAGSPLRTDVFAGILFMLLGVGLWYFGRDLPRGSALRMGPGYVPMLLAGAIFALGALLTVVGALSPPAPFPGIKPWSPVMIVAAILAFALTIEPLGIIAGSALAMLIGQGHRISRDPLRVVLVSLGIALGLTAIFVWGLKLPLNVLPGGR